MAVYKHEQDSYRAYRVTRSVGGKQIQLYFPRTPDGLRKAKARDRQLAKAQKEAAKSFVGGARRWSNRA